MLNESGNLISENIPISKDLLDFAKANNYKISLKTGEYSKDPLKANRAKNNPTLVKQLGELYLNRELYPAKCCEIFGLGKDRFTSMIRDVLKERYIHVSELYQDEIQNLHKQTMLKNHGVEYPSQSPEIMEKMKQSYVERYGVDCIFKSKEFQERTRNLWVEKYGVDNPMKSLDVQKRAVQTNLERLGVAYPMQSFKVRELSKLVCFERYGVDNPMKSEAVQQKFQNTMIERYGEPYALQNPILKDRLKASNMQKYGVENVADLPEIRFKTYQTNMKRYGCWHYIPSITNMSKVIGFPEAIERFKKLHALRHDPDRREELHEFIAENYSGTQYYVNLNKYGFRDSKFRTPSWMEVKLKQWLESKNIEFIENYRPEFMRHPETGLRRELDFWLLKHNLAIELNGDYTHSIEYGKDEHYHAFKFEKCFENNVKLLMFTESEIVNEFDKVCNIIEHHTSGVSIENDVEVADKFRFALVDQSIDDSTKVDVFEISKDFHHYYPVKIS